MPLVVGIVAAVALAALAELVARAARRRWVKPAALQPGLRERFTVMPQHLPTHGAVIRFDTNSVGERGDEPPPRGERAYRILVCGGSAAECFALDQAQSWPEVVKRALAREENLARLGQESVHVGNVARSLATPHYVAEILRRIRPRYDHIDLLVIMTGASNTITWLADRTPPAIEEHPPLPPNLLAVNPDGPYGWGPRRTALYRTFRDSIVRWFRLVKKAPMGRRLGQSRTMRAMAKTMLHDIPDPAVMVDHFERTFRELLIEARSMADRVMVVRQPWLDKDTFTEEEEAAFWHGAAGYPHLGTVDTYYALEVVTRLVRLVDARAASVCRDLDVQDVDLLPHLEPSLRSFYDFWHFTPAGAEIAGQVIAGAILDPTSPLPARTR
jgi:hypothetical protein